MPTRSATRCTEPALLKKDTDPLAPSGTVTRLAPVHRAGKLMLDAVGRVAPAGYAVTWPGRVDPVTVRLRTAAAVPLDGMMPRPAILSVTVWPWPTSPAR